MALVSLREHLSSAPTLSGSGTAPAQPGAMIPLRQLIEARSTPARAGTATPSGVSSGQATPRPPGFSRPESTPLSAVREVAGPLSLFNTVSRGAVPGLSPALSVFNLLSRFNDPSVSTPRLALGTAGDVTGLASAAANTRLGFDALSSVAGSVNAANIAHGLGVAAPVLGIGAGALTIAEGNPEAGALSIGAGAAGLAEALNLLPGIGLAAVPLALASHFISQAKRRDAEMKRAQAKEKALQAHLARGAISHMQNLVAGGFKVPDIMAYLTSPNNMSNQGHAGAGTAQFRSKVWAEMMRVLSDDVAATAKATGQPFATVWRNKFLALAPTLAQENRPLTYDLAEQPEYIGQANVDRLTAGMTPTPEMQRIADYEARQRINPEDPALTAETYQQAIVDQRARNLKLLMLGSPLRGAGQATENPAGGPNVFSNDPYTHLREGYDPVAAAAANVNVMGN